MRRLHSAKRYILDSSRATVIFRRPPYRFGDTIRSLDLLIDGSVVGSLALKGRLSVTLPIGEHAIEAAFDGEKFQPLDVCLQPSELVVLWLVRAAGTTVATGITRPNLMFQFVRGTADSASASPSRSGEGLSRLRVSVLLLSTAIWLASLLGRSALSSAGYEAWGQIANIVSLLAILWTSAAIWRTRRA